MLLNINKVIKKDLRRKGPIGRGPILSDELRSWKPTKERWRGGPFILFSLSGMRDTSDQTREPEEA